MKIFIILFAQIILLSKLFSNESEKITLRLDWLNQFQFAGYLIAKEKGFYKEKNLQVDIKELEGENDISMKVLENENTYGIGKSSLVLDRLRNENIVLLSAIFQSSPLVLISLKQSHINKIKDLKNKKVMITNSALNDVNIKLMISSQKVDIKDINFIHHSFNIDDLINGKTDLITSSLSNEAYILKEKNIKFDVFNPSDYGFDFYSGLLYTSKQELEKHPQRVKDFQMASLKGWKYAFENIEETARIIHEKYNTQNKSIFSLIYEGKVLKQLAFKNNPKYLGYIDPLKIDEIKRIYLALGLVNNPKIDLSDFIFDQKRVVLTQKEKEFLKNRQLSLISDGKNVPFSFYKNTRIGGIEIDLLKLISQRISKPYNVIQKPLDINILDSIKTNSIYFEFNYSDIPNDTEKLIFTDSLLDIPIALATYNDKNFITDLSILEGKKLAILKGSSLYKKICSTYKDVDFIRVDTKEEAFELLNKQKVFGFIDNILSLSHSILNEELPNIKISGILPFEFQLKISTTKQNAILVEIINKIIPFITEEKKKEIIKQYQLILINKINDFTWIYKFVIPLLLLLIIISLFNNKMRKEINKRKKAEKDLKDYANRDTLTSIYNRGKIDEVINSHIYNSKQTKRTSDIFSIIFFDIDNFKLINDNFGHNSGDDILKEIATLVSNNIRQSDIFGRWGGEEFIIILPKTTSEKAFILADNLKELICNHNFSIDSTVTVSFGVTQYLKNDTKDSIVQRADEAMYFVKKRGKNSVKIL